MSCCVASALIACVALDGTPPLGYVHEATSASMHMNVNALLVAGLATSAV